MEGLTRLARSAKATWNYPAEWLEAWASELTFTDEYVRQHAVLVATDDAGRILGTASLEAGPPPEIAHFWIATDAQGRGIGHLLADAVFAEARRRGWRELTVVSDPNAVGFYERLGGVFSRYVDAPVLDAARTLPVLVVPVADM